MTMKDEELVLAIQERQLRIAEREKQQGLIDILSLAISTEMALRDVKKVQAGEWEASQVDGERKSLEPTLLLEAGVSPEQIQKGTRVSRFTQLRVTRKG